MTALGCGCGSLASSAPKPHSGTCIPRLPVGESANLANAVLAHGLVVVDEFGRLHVGDGGAGGHVIAGAAGLSLFQVASVSIASRSLTPIDVKFLMAFGYYAPGDGGGGLATSEPTGEDPWFLDASGRPWFMAEAIRDVRMYGVRADGTDETEAFARAAAYPGVVALPKLARPYVLSGTIPVRAQLLRRYESAEIHLTTNGPTRGFWLQSGGAIEARIRRFCTDPYVGGGSGAFNNAVLIGTDAHTAAETVDWRLDAEIESVAPVGLSEDSSSRRRNVVTILGNAHRGRIGRLKISGFFEHGLMLHWWWEERLSSILGKTWHPRNIVIGELEVEGGAPWTSEVGAVLSGAHDVEIQRFHTRDCILGLVVQAGDVGGAYAQGPSAGRVLSGIDVEYMSTSGMRDSSIRVNGYGFPLVGGKRWLMTDSPSAGVWVGTLDVQRGDLSEAAAAVRFRMARNCHVENLVDSLAEGADRARLFSGALFEAAVDCSVAGATASARGAHLASGKNLRADLAATCPISSELTNNYVGVLMGGAAVSATLAQAVAVGAETAVFAAIGALVFPGMLFEAGGALFEFAEGFYADGHTPPGPVTLAIRPAPVAVSAGAAAALLSGAYNARIGGRASGYWAGLRIASSEAQIPRDVSFQGAAERCAMYGVYASGGANLGVLNSAFDFNGWMPGMAEQANVRFDGACTGVTLMGNSYNAKGGAGVAFNVYIRSTVSGVVNAGNRHYPLNEDRPNHAADFYQGGGNADRAVAANWYHPSITNKGE